MLSEVFYWLLNMSIIGSMAGMIILLLRRWKKIPKSLVYLLWVVPFIRLVIPFGAANRFSLMSLVSQFATRAIVVYEGSSIFPDFIFSNTFMAADSYFPIVYKTAVLENVFRIASAIWAVVSLAAILTAVILYMFTKAEIKGAALYKDNIYISDRITSPALYGMIHPKIIIPKSVVGEDLKYVTLHEKAHTLRHDNVWRCVAIFVCCIHWFNPMCWIFLKYFFEDMELSCDNKVLRKMDKEEAKGYAYAILNAAARRNMFVAAFGGAKIKVRMENILSYRKLTWISTVAFAVLVTTIIIVLITNAAP